MFLLLDKLNKDFSINAIFHFNESKRRGHNYYLDITVHSTREKIINLYISTIKDWCGNNYKNTDMILFPKNLEKEDNSYTNIFISTVDELIKKEKFCKSNKIKRWDIDSPEFEYGGDIEVVIEVLEMSGLFFSIVMFFHWLRLRIKTRIETNEIKKCIKAIKEKYKAESLIYYEMRPILDDAIYKKLYVFHQYVNNKLIAEFEVFYYIKTRHRKGKRYICEVTKTKLIN